MFAVAATNPLLLGPSPIAEPIAVPSYPSYVLPNYWLEAGAFYCDYCYLLFKDPLLTVPA